MSVQQVLHQIESDAQLASRITHWQRLPPREARYAEWPASLDPALVEVLQQRGIERLYGHQAAAVEAVGRGENVVVVTPTASGKTLCYNLPVLNDLRASPSARALYLFPTKALAQDQLAELDALEAALAALPAGKAGPPLEPRTYDGDTPPSARPSIRKTARIVISNRVMSSWMRSTPTAACSAAMWPTSSAA